MGLQGGTHFLPEDQQLIRGLAKQLDRQNASPFTLESCLRAIPCHHRRGHVELLLKSINFKTFGGMRVAYRHGGQAVLKISNH